MILSSGSLSIINAPKQIRQNKSAEGRFIRRPNRRNNSGDSKIKIIEAAGELFARQGLKGTNLRQICEKLEFHRTVIYSCFQSKEQLHKAALEYALDRENREIQKLDLLYADLPPVRRFRSLIHALLSHLMKSHSSSWHWPLICNEMIHSGDVFEDMASERFSPLFQCIGKALRQLSPKLREEDVKLVTMNVLGMIFQHSLYRLTTAKMCPEIDCTANSLEKIVTCIVNMSLASLRYVNESDRNESMVNHLFLFVRPQ